MADQQCGELDSVNTATSIITALATLLIALVAQIYSQAQAQARDVEEKRKQLKETSDDVHVQSVLDLFMSKRITLDGQSHYIYGSEWNDVWNPYKDYVERKPLAGRNVFSEYIDAVRACADVFDTVNTGKYKGKVWVGKYDTKTKNIRRTAKAFKMVYTMSSDGVADERRDYIQKEVGNEEDWKQMVNMFAKFVEFTPEDYEMFLWTQNKVEPHVSIADGDDEKDE